MRKRMAKSVYMRLMGIGLLFMGIGCGSPTLDTESFETLEASIVEMVKDAPAEKFETFDKALTYFADHQEDKFTEEDAKTSITRSEVLAWMASDTISFRILFLQNIDKIKENVARRELIPKSLKPLDGLTLEEISNKFTAIVEEKEKEDKKIEELKGRYFANYKQVGEAMKVKDAEKALSYYKGLADQVEHGKIYYETARIAMAMHQVADLIEEYEFESALEIVEKEREAIKKVQSEVAKIDEKERKIVTVVGGLIIEQIIGNVMDSGGPWVSYNSFANSNALYDYKTLLETGLIDRFKELCDAGIGVIKISSQFIEMMEITRFKAKKTTNKAGEVDKKVSISVKNGMEIPAGLAEVTVAFKDADGNEVASSVYRLIGVRSAPKSWPKFNIKELSIYDKYELVRPGRKKGTRRGSLVSTTGDLTNWVEGNEEVKVTRLMGVKLK